MHIASTCGQIQRLTGLLCLVTVSKLWLDNHSLGEGFSKWSIMYILANINFQHTHKISKHFFQQLLFKVCNERDILQLENKLVLKHIFGICCEISCHLLAVKYTDTDILAVSKYQVIYWPSWFLSPALVWDRAWRKKGWWEFKVCVYI